MEEEVVNVAEEVIEYAESIDYTPILEEINENLISVEVLFENHVESFENFQTVVENHFGTVDSFIDFMARIEEYSGYIAGFALFAVVVLLCYFAYKFFRMFF